MNDELKQYLEEEMRKLRVTELKLKYKLRLLRAHYDEVSALWVETM